MINGKTLKSRQSTHEIYLAVKLSVLYKYTLNLIVSEGTQSDHNSKALNK